jgi:hypothetical protein
MVPHKDYIRWHPPWSGQTFERMIRLNLVDSRLKISILPVSYLLCKRHSNASKSPSYLSATCSANDIVMPFRHHVPCRTNWTCNQTTELYLARASKTSTPLVCLYARFGCPLPVAWWMSSWDQKLWIEKLITVCNCYIDLWKCSHDARHGNLVGVASRQHAPIRTKFHRICDPDPTQPSCLLDSDLAIGIMACQMGYTQHAVNFARSFQ